ncbi:hypothetical protein AVEN_58395-1 [Araneus ventricosus]|uniref:Uncharacterized protein n=1 Tax=Araneus ventricosus TaxID=182803 RepID=A0A4Y2I9W8_ARAVE|nr:hypothetical protein AVEN_58395-1 [Araneus ventricosus]
MGLNPLGHKPILETNILVPDSNFSLQQTCTASLQAFCKFVASVKQACSKLTQASNTEESSLWPRSHHRTNLQQVCIANYSKNRVRTQPGIELSTSRFRSGDANH